ncbi:MAG: hypothetical protein DBX61_08500, partial [Clostridiales bacterium]
MDLQKRSDMLAKAKKMLSDKSESAKIRKDGKKTAYDLMNLLFDDGTFSETGAFVKAYANEIGTTDPAEYEGVVCGYGAVDGRLVFAYAQDISRTNGAFSKAAAGKISALYDLAVKNGAPVVSMLDSIGAKITEGVDVLAGYGSIFKKSACVKGKIPQVAIILGEATGAGALLASMSDASVICEGATFCQSPANVLVEAGASKDAGTAKYAADNGLASVYTANPEEAVSNAKEILAYLPSNRLDKNVYAGAEDDPNRATPEISAIVTKSDYDVHEIIKAIADGGVYKELTAAKSGALVTAFAFINGLPCGIVANNPAVKSGKLCAGGLRKAVNFVGLCNSFGLPVLNLVGTAGFDEKCEAHGGRVSELAAALAKAYATAEVPVVTVNVGEAYGTAFAVMGSKALGADIVYALDSAKIGPLKPSSSVAMMWSEKLAGSRAPIEKRKSLEEEWELYMTTPILAANAGQIDDIISDEQLRAKIASAMEMLSMKSEFAKL